MKVLLLVDDYLPHSIKVAARMMHDLALELKARGNDVSVCTAETGLQTLSSIDEFEGITVLRFKSGKIKNVSRIKRALNETLLSLRAWISFKNYFRENECHLIVYYSPTIFFGPLVWKLKSLWRCKSFLILRDIFPQWVVDNGLLKKNSLTFYYFKFFEQCNYISADVIAIQSPSNVKYFAHSPKHLPKLRVLYNWSSSNTASRNSHFSYREKLGLQGKIVFFYGGNIGHAQDMRNLLRLARSLSQYADAHFLFVGAGDEVDLIKQALSETKTSNVSYLPPVSQEMYEQLLNEFDVGLFSLHRAHQTHNFPGKLLGYMRYSMPIVGSVNQNNDLQMILTEANAGFVTINGEDEELAENAIKLLKSETLRIEMGKNAQKLLRDTFSVEFAAKSICDI